MHVAKDFFLYFVLKFNWYANLNENSNNRKTTNKKSRGRMNF